MTEKTPIGLRPSWIFQAECLSVRIKEILDAITRYHVAQMPVPQKWIDELHCRVSELNKHSQLDDQ